VVKSADSLRVTKSVTVEAYTNESLATSGAPKHSKDDARPRGSSPFDDAPFRMRRVHAQRREADRGFPEEARLRGVQCGDEIVEQLRDRPGVYKVWFSKRSAEIGVVASPNFDVYTSVKKLAAAQGFEAMLGEGRGAYLPPATFPEGADAKVLVADGAVVPELSALLAPGKVTVVDFSASWCKPCRLVDEHMVKVLATRRDVAYRKVDIGDWDTPTAKRYLRNVPKLPYVLVFASNGTQLKEFAGVDLAGIDAAIGPGAAKP
jgi:thiol-disulfide isomerase/thioredoxin